MATVEASALVHAARARKVGQPVRHADLAVAMEPALGPNLGSDAEWLAQISRAFARYVASRGWSGRDFDGDDMPAEG